MIKFIIISFCTAICQFGFAQSITQQGWPQAMAELYYHLDQTATKNYVVLVSLQPTRVMDFRTANGMRESINHFDFQKEYHPGHEMIGWKCKTGTVKHASVIGFNGEMNNQLEKMSNNGWGMTALLANFNDGFLETPSDLQVKFESIQEDLAKNPDAKHYLMTTVFEVSNEECAELINEVHNFTSHQNRPTKKFSIFAKAENYEGAVCNSFAMQLLSKIDSLQAVVMQFKRIMSLPKYLFRQGEGELPEKTTLDESLQKQLVKKPLSAWRLPMYDWSPSIDGQIEFNLTDPELILFWQRKFLLNYIEKENLFSHSEFKHLLKSTQRDFWERLTDIYNFENPKFKHVIIDKNYDERTNKIDQLTDIYLRDKKIAYKNLDQFPILIIEKQQH
jgi:hypothetical protein